MTSSFYLVALLTCSTATAMDADFLIRGGQVYDGTGSEPVMADVAIRGERIVAVGRIEPGKVGRVIDATGLVVAPGFIDLHTHSDRMIREEPTRDNRNYLFQGVTTVVTGNCGMGPLDVAEYLNGIDQGGAGTNVAHLVPHGSLRGKYVADAQRPPTPEELAAMKEALAAGMQAGAWGMSTGLIYTPGSFADTAELIELSRIVAAHGGLYVSHMRSEGTRVLQSIDELVRIGREAKLPVHISHFKVSGSEAWGLAPAAIEKVRQARDEGLQVTADQYPYTASSTSLSAMMVPDRYRGTQKLFAVLEDAERGPKVREEMEQYLQRRGGGQLLTVASYAANRAWQGQNLKSLADQQNVSVLDLALEILRNGGAQMINFGMQEEEVRLIMQQDFVATASDGSATRLDDPTQPHPRCYGCFPRKIGRYALRQQLVSMAQAMRSASGLPADILHLPDRGYLRPGSFADVVVLDPKEFIDTATFEKPHQYATGVRYLLVNGQLAVAAGDATGVRAGRSLRHAMATHGHAASVPSGRSNTNPLAAAPRTPAP